LDHLFTVAILQILQQTETNDSEESPLILTQLSQEIPTSPQLTQVLNITNNNQLIQPSRNTNNFMGQILEQQNNFQQQFVQQQQQFQKNLLESFMKMQQKMN
jgi:TRAP-type mannitol/chloroaromatic compound transport system substrate-binding protein